ncbi:Septin-type guanine nucleotide-binding (G) domain-containing protein [Spinellus fusiger]|nr:Septin-type guanine nucleotide-binding (G) domain-containing protein [Spinellus fusiger]
MAPRSRKHTTSNLNVMVVGFSGVGKTAFIKTLVEALKYEHPNSNWSAMEEHPHLQGLLTKTTEPYTVSVDLELQGEKVVLTLIDTPGFKETYLADQHLHDLVSYIEHQFDLTLEEESKVKRNPKAVDTQVHACLYFIDPTKTSLDEDDLKILTHLSRRVNVIPVVAKADTLTKAQRQRLKPMIMQSIYNTNIKIPFYGLPEEDSDSDSEEDTKEDTTTGSSLEDFLGQFDYENEDEETRTLMDYIRMLPFTVIAYEDNPETGRPLAIKDTPLGRDYGWGTIDCLSEVFSDFSQLKSMLLITHRVYLKSSTLEDYYERYRTERLTMKRQTKLKSMNFNKKILEDFTKA